MSSLLQIQKKLRSGEYSCVQLTEAYLERIAETQPLNIYVEVYTEEIREKAAALDKKIKDAPGQLGKLFGLILSVKDVLAQQGKSVTAGSKILEGYISPFSATAIERLLAEDALIIGRVNCDEFAMGSANENSVYGPTANAANPELVPGGSSGASAVSVQADTCLVSLGTDTGGSVRQPAGFCGIIGFKPTYGRVSRYGLLAYGSSFDQVGVLAKNVENIALVLAVMAGPDEFDATASQQPVPDYAQALDFSGKARIAYFDAALSHNGMDPEIRRATQAYIDKLQQDGHTVESVAFEYLDYLVPAYYVLTTAEASSNLSRYDGVRFGHRSKAAGNLTQTYTRSRTEGFGEEVKRRIMLGTFVLSAGYYDAYFTKAQQVRRLIQQRTHEILNKYDYILMPVSPVFPWKIGEKKDDPVEAYLADIFTVQANMAGVPGICLPFGKSQSGIPFGIQFLAGPFGEASLLAFAHYLNQRISLD